MKSQLLCTFTTKDKLDNIIESIIYPHKKIVKGYPDQMNSYKDLLSDYEIKALVEYIKNLGN